MKFLEITPRYGMKTGEAKMMINLETVTSIQLGPNQYGNYLIRMSHDQIEVSRVGLAHILEAIKEEEQKNK